MNKMQLEQLILAAELLVERLFEGEDLCELNEVEWSEETENELQQALLDGIEALRARLADYE